MAKYVQLRNGETDELEYPVTKAACTYMEDNTTVEATIATIKQQIQQLQAGGGTGGGSN